MNCKSSDLNWKDYPNEKPMENKIYYVVKETMLLGDIIIKELWNGVVWQNNDAFIRQWVIIQDDTLG